MSINFLFLVLIAALVGAASGYLGSFMVIKRMSLVGDALSHVALPGIAIALMLGMSPMLGAFTALTIAVVGIWYLAERSEVYPEALVGIFFTASLAIGILITPEPELLEALFGSIDKITYVDGLAIVFGAIIIFVLAKLISKKLLLGIVSDDLARTSGANMGRINLIYLLLVGLVVALGVKFLGTLLTGALVIIPAAAAKNISRSITAYFGNSILFGVLSSVLGLIVGKLVNLEVGPVVVIISALIFAATYILRTRSQ